ncbi:MAG: septum formation initiator family protein [Acidobacteriia bacterium]|jgi:cell division protein FtsB|nr:septum formation initiator family protein [Terriglobia bacterium]
MLSFRWEDARFRRAAMAALALLALALTVHEIFGEHGYLALRRRRQELQTLQEQVKQLQEENQKLEQQIKALKSDPKAIEKLAREQMKLARPGEVIYVLPDRDTQQEPPAAAKK